MPPGQDVRGPVSAARAGFNGKQPGDPDKAAAAVLRLIDLDEPPTHLLLGSDALSAATGALRQFNDEIERHRDLSLSTDYDPVP